MILTWLPLCRCNDLDTTVVDCAENCLTVRSADDPLTASRRDERSVHDWLTVTSGGTGSPLPRCPFYLLPSVVVLKLLLQHELVHEFLVNTSIHERSTTNSGLIMAIIRATLHALIAARAHCLACQRQISAPVKLRRVASSLMVRRAARSFYPLRFLC